MPSKLRRGVDGLGTMRTVPLSRALVAVALIAVAGAGCGDPSGLDREDPDAVCAAALRAVSERNLDALWPLLTEGGRERLERLLRTWQTRLRDPERGAYLLSEIEARRGTLRPEEVEVARYGTLRDVWHFLLLADPRPAAPPTRPPRTVADGNAVLVDYEHPPGTLHTVRLVRAEDGWRIDDIQI